ncbi:zinc ABC transporter, inner membrane permease protein ZnuB [Lentilactobacillus kosonis]|uniref:Zinc ABC transporter, inner membrane permease protein ZnuB n=1 Tax=Lentilactobacillus kosonis TaxID=2810561 RepID=A0A401FP88_9LACO|nr:zinc ABC transporter, inner membrane permease protein ZnuB [Lentilactobacillus kosonis]
MIGISAQDVQLMGILSSIVLIVVLFIYRNLKADSFDAIGAKINGVNSQAISIVFLLLLAMSVSVAAQIVGSLLIFILLTLPASSAKYFTHTVFSMIMVGIAFSLTGVWLGLYLGYVTNWPVTFFIACIEALIYGIALLYNSIQNRS